MEGHAAAAQGVDHGLVDGADDLRHLVGPDARARASTTPCRRCSARGRRRRCACSPGPAPSPPPARRRTAPAARAPRPRGAPRPRPARCRSGARPAALQRLARRALVLGDHHPLARGQAVGLDHRRVALDDRHGLVQVGDHAVVGRGHAGRGHDLLGEGLGALQPRRRAARPEAGDAGLGQRVGQAVDERRLGPHDHEVHRLVARSRDQPVEVVDAELERARIPRDAGVARRGEEVGRGRRAPQRPHDGVLAPARADDEDPHRRRSRSRARSPR